MHKSSKEELINAAKRADKKIDGPLSQNDFIRLTGYREWQIENLFPDGGWSELKRLAKIDSQPKPPKKLTGRRTIKKKKPVAKKRTVTKKKTPVKTKVVAQQDVITEFDRADLKDINSNRKTIQPPSGPPVQSKKELEDRIKMEIAEFGELIDFRGLRHAPINENGVIYLFGMISHEIGFMVEAVHAVFPDCEAKRHIGNNRYQRVRIKFEYKSSNFKSQGYDTAGADMIVCWIHDWPDCPLEVLDLKSEIDKLKK
jgi:hypothetical protein